MRLIGISDTHSYHRSVKVPEGDVLIHAGDITWRGELEIIKDFADWLKELPHRHKLVIHGNHEIGHQYGPKREPGLAMLRDAGATYLQDSGVEIDGLSFWGSPFQPFFHNWEYNLFRGKPLADKWALIPEQTNVLTTHGGPHQILDEVERASYSFAGAIDVQNVGCEDLAQRIKHLPNLKAHFFGHLHFNGGKTKIIDGVVYANCAICEEHSYKPTNPPIIVDL
jgi:Icc-related predicted phosphoesterase